MQTKYLCRCEPHTAASNTTRRVNTNAIAKRVTAEQKIGKRWLRYLQPGYVHEDGINITGCSNNGKKRANKTELEQVRLFVTKYAHDRSRCDYGEGCDNLAKSWSVPYLW